MENRSITEQLLKKCGESLASSKTTFTLLDTLQMRLNGDWGKCWKLLN